MTIEHTCRTRRSDPRKRFRCSVCKKLWSPMDRFGGRTRLVSDGSRPWKRSDDTTKGAT